MNLFKCKNPFENKVKCEVCFCWLDKKDAKEVKTNIQPEYYCYSHKPPYTRISYPSYLVDSSIKYFKEFEVNAKGKIKVIENA